MNGCIFPGRIISCAGAACFGCTTETEGTAICAVTLRKLAAALRRDRIPKTRIAKATAPTVRGIIQACGEGRPFSGSGSSGTISTLFAVSLISKLVISIHLFLFGQCSLAPPTVQQAEKRWDEEERRNCREEKTADDRSSERRVL